MQEGWRMDYNSLLIEQIDTNYTACLSTWFTEIIFKTLPDHNWDKLSNKRKIMGDKIDLQEKLNLLRDIYENQMPFHRLLDIQIESLTPEKTTVRIDMREELIGNFVQRILHGGVISSVLDLTGGLIAFVEIIRQLEHLPADELRKRLARVGTIDLRVDYLRMGEGLFFTASGSVLRKGNKVAVIRTELYNNKELLIAAGTGTYLVG
jgi:uncharacterized protein (TIGR00369 family)